ncbi:hypothetical protein NAU58_18115 [Pseudomonas stutzeri]|uniref:Uncharacterized protein n=1 Tax=Stutzerimonas stutzeri TaxID=316 RepID=A0A2N8RZ21_STUST|nr:hypothetical protein [Stutzerimonas stutzeri]MCQ4297497.1 hypothetical protein [Stutzerimonas stutzeri]PNF79634.1 hypothetical protein CXK92_13375 [Stutzerimonas stutzeri]
MAGFGDSLAAMDAAIMASLNDGTAGYLNAAGTVLASGVEVILDRDVERLDTVSGMLDRAVTITVRKASLQPFDRRGAFRLDGKTWHIDGIATDDGHWLTLYVVP